MSPIEGEPSALRPPAMQAHAGGNPRMQAMQSIQSEMQSASSMSPVCDLQPARLVMERATVMTGQSVPMSQAGVNDPEKEELRNELAYAQQYLHNFGQHVHHEFEQQQHNFRDAAARFESESRTVSADEEALQNARLTNQYQQRLASSEGSLTQTRAVAQESLDQLRQAEGEIISLQRSEQQQKWWKLT